MRAPSAGKRRVMNGNASAQAAQYAPVLLRAAVRDAEASHDLVEHEHRAVVRAQLAQLREELLVGNDEARVADDRF